jgi:hypothetical protein
MASSWNVCRIASRPINDRPQDAILPHLDPADSPSIRKCPCRASMKMSPFLLDEMSPY